ncbi:MAG: CBS domain-containing protein [Leptospiraceae bacterium]|nr:CBS domain-containing protein [Leptospiraceae bacterium]MCP5500036.1 CBS domain-containing protein [Leptospiraceae bacterium]
MSIVKQIMKTGVFSEQASNTVFAACKKMTENKTGSIMVEEAGKIVGIFTERDVLNRVISEGKDPSATKLSDVMTKDPISIQEGASVGECVNLIKEKGFRHVLVKDSTGKASGILSTRDFLQFITDRLDRLVDDAIYKKFMEEGIDPYDTGSYT